VVVVVVVMIVMMMVVVVMTTTTSAVVTVTACKLNITDQKQTRKQVAIKLKHSTNIFTCV
jgi:hypothetical protein